MKSSTSQPQSPDWAALIKAQKESGLTQKAFCEQHKIKNSTFGYHRYKCKNKSKGQFVAVAPRAASPAFPKPSYYELLLPYGKILRIPLGYEPGSLKILINLLKECG